MPAPKNGIKKHNGGGASKAKGQIRAKSGCYTCRIRRKKCDEARNDEGRCANCERLKVQCLGFGPKRPDWLKDKQSDWIKRIKAHCAGSGKNRASTSSPQATDYLVLLPLDESDGDMSPHDSPASHTSFELPEYPDFSATTPQMIDPLYTFDDTSALSAGMSTFDATSYDPLSTLSTVATISHLAPSYNANYMASDYDFPLEDELYPYGAIQPMLMPGDAIVNHYVHHYVNEVAGKQFLLIDRATLAFLSETINNSSGGLAFSAVRLLSNIHAQRQVHGDVSCFAGPAIMNQYELTKQLLSHRRQTHVYTADEAWGALFVTSSFLFDGGRGEWDLWIHVACQYARRFVKDDPRGALARSNPPERLLIKSAIWFDVLAAVTTRRRPEMMREIRQLFHPQVSRIQDIEEEDDVTSMMSPMGCESRVVWALAETLDLAVWKEEKLKLGQLSVPELYNRAREIETYLSQPPAQCTSQDQTALKRYFCSEMFRTSTILFLRSVVSGSHPAVYEIRSAVKNVFGVLNKMRRDFPEIVPSVVRMTVFSFFLCGSLTDEDSSRRDIFTILNGEGNVGNCSSLGRLLQHQIWSNRPLMSTSPDPVLWREALQAEKMLLV